MGKLPVSDEVTLLQIQTTFSFPTRDRLFKSAKEAPNIWLPDLLQLFPQKQAASPMKGAGSPSQRGQHDSSDQKRKTAREEEAARLVVAKPLAKKQPTSFLFFFWPAPAQEASGHREPPPPPSSRPSLISRAPRSFAPSPGLSWSGARAGGGREGAREEEEEEEAATVLGRQ